MASSELWHACPENILDVCTVPDKKEVGDYLEADEDAPAATGDQYPARVMLKFIELWSMLKPSAEQRRTNKQFKHHSIIG